MSEVNKAITLQQAKTLYDDLRERNEALVKSYEKLTFPVNQGTLCVYNGTTYIAKQDIQNSESWTAAHWNVTNIGEELTDVKTAINGKYTKPQTGIPASDIASGVIPDVSGKIDATEKGAANGVAMLDALGKVPSSQLPSMESLPAVSSADNGKILQVVNGAWAAAMIPSANGVSF